MAPVSRFGITLLAAILAAFAVCASGSGCASQRYDGFPSRAATADLTDDPIATPVRRLPMFTGDGAAVSWDDLLQATDWAHVVILGEQHDDAVAHAVQLAMVEDVFDRAAGRVRLRTPERPYGSPSHPYASLPTLYLSMEMLERDEQILVDDYFEGIIDTAAFIRLTHSANWGGEGKFIEWYQPIIDTVKDRSEGGTGVSPVSRSSGTGVSPVSRSSGTGVSPVSRSSGTGVSPVIAANAPRRYVRLARTHGYERLRAMPHERRKHFDLPRDFKGHLRSDYRARFGEVMRHVHNDDAEERRINAVFRSQLLWDATMAASIARAFRTPPPLQSWLHSGRQTKVIHLVGQFHSDFDGGLVRELRARLPGVRILTVSMQRRWQDSLHEDDYSRADVVIYTGERPQAVEEDEQEEEETEEGNATESTP